MVRNFDAEKMRTHEFFELLAMIKAGKLQKWLDRPQLLRRHPDEFVDLPRKPESKLPDDLRPMPLGLLVVQTK